MNTAIGMVIAMVNTPQGLAFKAYEIEEMADVYFFRPLGMVVAREYMHDVGPIRGVGRQHQQVAEQVIHLRRGRRLQHIECVPKGVPFALGFAQRPGFSYFGRPERQGLEGRRR